MLSWSITFLVIALIAGVLGFTGIAGTATQIAWILFVVFLILFVVSLITGRGSGRPIRVGTRCRRAYTFDGNRIRLPSWCSDSCDRNGARTLDLATCS